jgi:hypothetical protein
MAVMAKRSTEYRATIAQVKRGLQRIGSSQNRAARATAQSAALVSMVLSRKVKSQPCLDKLAAFINAEARNGVAAA